MSWNIKLKDLRIERGLTQDDLAQKIKKDHSWISQAESGRLQSLKHEDLLALAKAFDLKLSQMSAYLYGSGSAVREVPVDYDPLTVIKERLEAAELVAIPLRGYVSAGTPLPQEQQDLGDVRIPKSELSGVAKVSGLFGLQVSGDSLAGDEIGDGDFVVVDPNASIVDGKIYIVQLGNEFVARHLHREDGSIILTSSNGKYARMKAGELEVKGRVVYSGHGRRH
jgi:DNA polymerase V